MDEVIATLSAPEVTTIRVVKGADAEFAFDVVVDGVIFDSFTTLQAAMGTATSLFKAAFNNLTLRKG